MQVPFVRFIPRPRDFRDASIYSRLVHRNTTSSNFRIKDITPLHSFIIAVLIQASKLRDTVNDPFLEVVAKQAHSSPVTSFDFQRASFCQCRVHRIDFATVHQRQMLNLGFRILR